MDASLHGALVAVFASEGGQARLLASRSHSTHTGAMQHMGALVRAVLAEASCEVEGLAGVVLGHGPGSFTGIRVGLAYGYGLIAGQRALASHGFPAWGCSALAAAAWSLADSVGASVQVAMPATKTHGFVATATIGTAAAEVRTALVDLSAALDGTSGSRPQHFGSEVVYLASPWPLAETYLAQQQREPGSLSHESLIHHTLRGVAHMVGRAWPKEFGAALPRPVYLRLSTPEERLATGNISPRPTGEQR